MIFETLPSPFFVLAPMDDVTDTVFRSLVQEIAPADLYFTEFANVDGFQSPGKKAIELKFKLGKNEGPVVAQLWGKNPENYYKTVLELKDRGFVAFDINMGCPDKAVVKNGCCSALIENRPLAVEIIKAVKKAAGDMPVTVKTRLGFNEVDLSWIELLLQQGIDALTIHGRTRKEMSLVPAHWDTIGEIVKLRDKIAPHTKIIGNGDVKDRRHGLELAREYGVDGIMIGRGIFHNIFAFDNESEAKKEQLSLEDRKALYKKHIELFVRTWPEGERKLVMLNKFCKTYIQGFDGVSELREKLMNAKSAQELVQLLS